MAKTNNVNVNGSEKGLKNNVNVIDRAKEVELIAHQLVDKFKSRESFPFYCKVAYSLPESTIWSNYEQSLKGRTPAKLFNFLCRRDMSRR